MPQSKWKKVDFKEFIDDFGINIIVNKAPIILFSKKDKEKEQHRSFILFIILFGSLLFYLTNSFIFYKILYQDYLSISLYIIIALSVCSVFLFFNFITSNINIKPIECWIEIYKRILENKLIDYCFVYYPIFTGKCHPNEGFNIINKLFHKEVFGTTVDITQIEVYLKLNKDKEDNNEDIGFAFRYTKGNPFKSEDVNKNPWKFFSYEKSLGDNYIAIGNWAHHYEWRYDLVLDFDKLNEYAPWIIQKWDETNIKPITKEFKFKIGWENRFIESEPKFKPWEDNFNEVTTLSAGSNHNQTIINDAINKIMGMDIETIKDKDINPKLFEFKVFFQDLKKK